MTAVISFCSRLRYFMAFKFAQAAMDGMGITYNSKDANGKVLLISHELGKDLYDRFLTADYYRYETSYNTLIKTTCWNQTV